MNQEMIGESAVMQELRRQIQQAASSALPCLITGETGSGKELVAWEIFQASRREPYICQSCAGLPDGLVYSEFFGHKKGVFTGADENKAGKFVDANGGTLFLDEIGDFPLKHQATLLRAIDPGQVTPLGTSSSIKVDVRLIAATNQDLDTLVEKDQFRKDLLFRLRGVEMAVPPLRKRSEDIPLLVRYFATRLGASVELDPGALDLMVNYPWPGNVRELKCAIEAARLAAGKDRIGLEHLKLAIREYRIEATREVALRGPGDSSEEGSAEQSEKGMEQSLDHISFLHVRRLMNEGGNNISQTAKLLGINRETLRMKIKKWRERGWWDC